MEHSIIVGQGQQVTTGKAFFLSLVYVEAVALTYAVIGVVSAQVGAGVQAFFQNPLILVFFALVFVALALSMFGFYNLQLPASLQAKLSDTSNRMKGQLKKASDVIRIPAINNMALERTGYPTQKPLALLSMLVKACCPPGSRPERQLALAFMMTLPV